MNVDKTFNFSFFDSSKEENKRKNIGNIPHFQSK